jgi:hypothetical protein
LDSSLARARPAFHRCPKMRPAMLPPYFVQPTHF